MKKKHVILLASLAASCSIAIVGVIFGVKNSNKPTGESNSTVESLDSSISSPESLYSGISSHENSDEYSSSIENSIMESSLDNSTSQEISVQDSSSAESANSSISSPESSSEYTSSESASSESSSENTSVDNSTDSSVTEQPTASTEGLEYTLSNDGTYYTVTGIGTATDTNIVIPSTYNNLPVTSIGDYAFRYCSSLTSITIPDSVIFIGNFAFHYSCSSLTSIIVDENNSNYKSIDGNLYNKDGSTLIQYAIGKTDAMFVISKSVTSVGDCAFRGCSSLTIVIIPDSVTSIGWGAFLDCRRLTSVMVGEKNLNYKSIDGNLYNKGGSTLIQYAIGKTDTMFIIPNSVTSIGNSAFSNCSSLTGITIPDSVTSIGSYAFYGCNSLMSITLPFVGNTKDGAENTYFGYIFGASSYSDNSSYVPTSLKTVIITGSSTIASSAFLGCSSLTSITIPESVTSIGGWAFYGCSSLTSITLPFVGNTKDGAGNTCFGYIFGASSYSDHSRYVPTSLKTVVITGGSMIADYAFRYCSSLTSVTIPDSVTSIGEEAFSYCDSLTGVYITDIAAWCAIDFENNSSNPLDYAKNLYLNNQLVTDLVIPNSVTSIGGWAFYGCSCLTSVTIGNGVTSIGNYAFYGCSSLTSITIPNSVTSIGDYAFYNCPIEKATMPTAVISFIPKFNLKELVITSGSIGSSMFNGCSGLTSITIGNAVTSIGKGAFSDCSGLTGITVDENNPNYASWDGILYNKAKTEFIHIPKAITGDITIPDSITSIGDYVFSNCNGLTSITIPDSVIFIGNFAFHYSCSSLTSIIVDENNPNYKSIDGNLYNKDGSTLIQYAIGKTDTTFVIPDSVTSIGNSAFMDCSSLTSVTIPDSVTSISDDAFSNCSSLTSITIPDSVTSIGNAAFACNLTSVYITDIAAWCAIDFGGAASNPLYYAKNLYLNNQLVTDLVIPNSVTFIGKYAFYGYSGLTSIAIPDSVTSIGGGAFYNCSSLSEITIPDSVTSIGVGAFSDCSSLTSITLPDSVTSIGDVAFSSCSSLTSITIPDSVTSIGDYAFYDCSSLTGVYITDIAAWCAIDFGGAASNPLYYAKNLYLNNQLVTDLVIPNSVTSIGKYAFYGYSGLTSIAIPEGVTSIGESVFAGCSNLTSITIPNSVTSIGNSAFSGCSGLTEMTLPFVGGSKKMGSDTYHYPFGYIFGSSSYTGAKKTQQHYYSSSTSFITYTTYYIPTNLKKVTVTGGNILYNAFSNCSSLMSVTIGNGVTFIGDYAFKGCSGLTSVTIPNSVTSIGYSAFYGCTDLIQIENGVSYVDKWVVDCDESVTSVSLRTDTKKIADSAFSVGSSLTRVTIPDSVTSIGDYAFNGCSDLTSVIIGNGVTSIGDYAFSSCSKLTSITVSENNLNYKSIDGNLYNKDGSKLIQYAMGKTDTMFAIPDSVTSIGMWAFSNCSSLTSVTIGGGVTSIGEEAFSLCSGLTSVYYEGTSEQWSEISIGSYNWGLTNATRFYYSETEPSLNGEGTAYDGSYWRYVDGVPTAWVKGN